MAKVNFKEVPPRQKFKPGTKDPRFKMMGRRMKKWLGNKNMAKDGKRYKPTTTFTKHDVKNVKRIQRMMGDSPDGWFGPKQWKELRNRRPPRKRPGNRRVPVKGMRITQHFGNKSSGYAAGEHTGIDFGSNGNDKIRSTGRGRVVYVGYDGSWGKRVIVRHPNGRYSWYCHLRAYKVQKGQRVRRGKVVGLMGNTGNSTAKHLHYQETVNGYGYYSYRRPIMIRSHGY